MNIPYFEVSAKSDFEIKAGISRLVEDIWERIGKDFEEKMEIKLGKKPKKKNNCVVPKENSTK